MTFLDGRYCADSIMNKKSGTDLPKVHDLTQEKEKKEVEVYDLTHILTPAQLAEISDIVEECEASSKLLDSGESSDEEHRGSVVSSRNDSVMNLHNVGTPVAGTPSHGDLTRDIQRQIKAKFTLPCKRKGTTIKKGSIKFVRVSGSNGTKYIRRQVCSKQVLRKICVIVALTNIPNIIL